MLAKLVLLSIFSLALGQYYQPQQQQQQPQHQDDGQYRPTQYREEYSQPTRPPPKITMFKQAQNHDGAFKYAFAAENGLAQGEVIAPDGSRNGGYTYVDPHGKKISVKYTAGKEGFRIIEGDHIPRNPQAVPQAAPQETPYNHYQNRHQEDDGSYTAEKYEKPYNGPQTVNYQPPISIYQGKPAGSYPQALPPRHYQPQPYQNQIPQPQIYQKQIPQPEYHQPQPSGNYHNQHLGFSRPQQAQPQSLYQPPQPKYEQRSNQIDEEKEPEYHDAPGKPNTFGNGYFFEFAG